MAVLARRRGRLVFPDVAFDDQFRVRVRADGRDAEVRHCSSKTYRTRRPKEPTVSRNADMPRAGASGRKEFPMAQKHQRSNREAKKPKQNKPKVVISTSPFAAA